ncbi:hypothetical protein THL1_2280 [Pseudomonas sp. TCU-HL1]|nr:hypothetical protein THL1_2280 [Pseudomonas sp. TCU-HL1]
MVNIDGTNSSERGRQFLLTYLRGERARAFRLVEGRAQGCDIGAVYGTVRR